MRGSQRRNLCNCRRVCRNHDVGPIGTNTRGESAPICEVIELPSEITALVDLSADADAFDAKIARIGMFCPQIAPWGLQVSRVQMQYGVAALRKAAAYIGLGRVPGVVMNNDSHQEIVLLYTK